jgi:hypothetical protein
VYLASLIFNAPSLQQMRCPKNQITEIKPPTCIPSSSRPSNISYKKKIHSPIPTTTKTQPKTKKQTIPQPKKMGWDSFADTQPHKERKQRTEKRYRSRQAKYSIFHKLLKKNKRKNYCLFSFAHASFANLARLSVFV